MLYCHIICLIWAYWLFGQFHESVFMFVAFYFSGMDSPSERLSLISKWVQGSPTSPLSVFHSRSLWPLTLAAAHSDILYASSCLLFGVVVLLLSSWAKPFYSQLFISVPVWDCAWPLSHWGWNVKAFIQYEYINGVALRGGSLTFCSFTYPVDGYHPLQDPPTVDLIKAKRLLGYMKNVMSTGIDTQVQLMFMPFFISLLQLRSISNPNV